VPAPENNVAASVDWYGSRVHLDRAWANAFSVAAWKLFGSTKKGAPVSGRGALVPGCIAFGPGLSDSGRNAPRSNDLCSGDWYSMATPAATGIDLYDRRVVCQVGGVRIRSRARQACKRAQAQDKGGSNK
jgi:hypothetical protein